jgi:hypothetical protein
MPSTDSPTDPFAILCLLARAKLGSEQTEEIARWDQSALDWNEIIRLAEYHGVLSFIARNLIDGDIDGDRTVVPALPPAIERSLRSAYQLNLSRNLWFTAELARIIRHFDRHQLAVLPFKGPALSESLYGDCGLRSFSDLDLIISPSDFDRAKAALAGIGYSPAKKLSPAIERFWLQYGYEQSFDGPAGKNAVELQWALLPKVYAVDLKVDNLLARSVIAMVGGCPMRCLSAEDSLLVLSLHAAKHLWGRLIWLVDIAETLRTTKVDYDLVISHARNLGIARILAVTFWLARNVLDAELPELAAEMLASDSSVATLGQEFVGRLARGAMYDFASTEYFRLILKLRERPSHQFRYLWRLLWTPGQGDLDAAHLPEAIFPLYRIVRIGRLMRKLPRH